MIDLADWFIADCHVHGPARDGSLWQPFHAIGGYKDYLRYLRRCGVQVAVQNTKDAVLARSAGALRDANEHAIPAAAEGSGPKGGSGSRPSPSLTFVVLLPKSW